MSLHVTTKRETELGAFEFTATSMDHVSINGATEIRGIKYYVHVHLYLSDSWKPRDRDSVHISRDFTQNIKAYQLNAPIAKTVHDKVLKVCTEELEKLHQENSKMFWEAHHNGLEYGIERAKAKMAEAQALVDAEKAEIEKLEKELILHNKMRRASEA